jgi:undecaprenyl diphosphate synthase
VILRGTAHVSSTREVPAPRDVPRHVAIIMDGNGRWAKQRHLPRVAGHRRGVEAVRDTVRACLERGVEYLTLFAFSTENWRRPADEVSILMDLFVRALDQEVEKLHKNGIRFRTVGDTARFSPRIRELIAAGEALTAANTRLTLSIAANYGGRWDIAQAARRYFALHPEALRDDAEIAPEALEPFLAMAFAPEPDLFIRTGGEQRVSNFLLWQLAYSELFFTDLLWPDFDATALGNAITWFQQRERRFGRTSEQLRVILDLRRADVAARQVGLVQPDAGFAGRLRRARADRAGNDAAAHDGPRGAARNHGRRLGGRHRRLFQRPRLRPSQAGSGDQPGQDLGGRRGWRAGGAGLRLRRARDARRGIRGRRAGDRRRPAGVDRGEHRRRPLRVAAQASGRPQGQRQHPARPRRHARPHRQPDVVVAAIVGAAGLGPTRPRPRAASASCSPTRRRLVIGGAAFMAAVRAGGAVVLPLDSEHNAIFQCLPAGYAGNPGRAGVRRILLTASGGPFRNRRSRNLSASRRTKPVHTPTG